MRRLVAIAIVAGATMASPAITNAAPPLIQKDRGFVTVEVENGAFVRITGDTSYVTIKFQYGWSSETDAAEFAAGYWVGVYDVTRSKYVWSSDTGPIETPDQLFRNAIPTYGLLNGEYKVVFFVRSSYETNPYTNVAEIDGVHFFVDYPGGVE